MFALTPEMVMAALEADPNYRSSRAMWTVNASIVDALAARRKWMGMSIQMMSRRMCAPVSEIDAFESFESDPPISFVLRYVQALGLLDALASSIRVGYDVPIGNEKPGT